MHARHVGPIGRRHERISAGEVQLLSGGGDNAVPLQHNHRVRVAIGADMSVIAKPAVARQGCAQPACRRRAHAPVYPARIGTSEMSLVLDVHLADQLRDQFHILGDQLGAPRLGPPRHRAPCLP